MTLQERIKELPRQGFYVLLAYMPFHIFLSQWLSTYTGGLSVWKGAKDAIIFVLVTLAVILVWVEHKSNRVFNWLVWITVAYGVLHLLVWAVNPHIYKDTAILGSVYNIRLLWFLLIGMSVRLLWSRIDENHVIRIILLISSVVCVLGVLQYFLPKDLLTHFGYSLARGVKPAFFIDDKTNLPRIMSTLRDPNSLGAYLIVPITLLVYKLFTVRPQRRQLVGGLLIFHGWALLLTFSRSAWLGTVISVAVLAAYKWRAQLKPLLAKYWPILIGSILLIGSLTLMFRHQYAVQNILVHGDQSTALKSQYDSNGYHWLYTKRGLEGIVHQPQGHGPGTAGLVSIQNPNGGFLTENYYVQIGYEVGVLGLVLLLLVHLRVYKELLRRLSPLSVALIGSFWGYMLCNMLLHTWSNEAVAAQWWLLAGLVVFAPKVTKRHPKNTC